MENNINNFYKIEGKLREFIFIYFDIFKVKNKLFFGYKGISSKVSI